MKWKIPPVIKIYEALGAVADERVHVKGDTVKVYSSSGNKYYEVTYDAKKGAIMTNDNGSYWKGYLGYPAIAFLLKKGVLEYKSEVIELFAGIPWKDLNTKFKNDFEKTIEYVFNSFEGGQREQIEVYAEELLLSIRRLDLKHLGTKQKPPEEY